MIGEKLKDLIAKQNIKQAEMAKSLCISQARLSNYINDKREPDLEMLAKMARFLKVDVNYFAGMETSICHIIKEIMKSDCIDLEGKGLLKLADIGDAEFYVIIRRKK